MARAWRGGAAKRGGDTGRRLLRRRVGGITLHSSRAVNCNCNFIARGVSVDPSLGWTSCSCWLTSEPHRIRCARTARNTDSREVDLR